MRFHEIVSYHWTLIQTGFTRICLEQKSNPISETFTSHLKKLKFSLFSGIFSEVKNI